MFDLARRQAQPKWKDTVTTWLLGALPAVFGILRTIWPIPKIGRFVGVTRHDPFAKPS